MSNIFLISDTHFGHKGVTEFTGNDGNKLRPWENVEEMDEALVANWNSVVKAEDKVYHLGDVVINRKALSIMYRLNGKKVLVKGNHDIFKLEDYTPHFYDIRGSYKLENFLLTHIPVHPASLARWTDGNIHGHLHDGRVMKEVLASGSGEYFSPDLRYTCVSVERINYTPIAFEDLKQQIEQRRNG